MYLYSTVQYTDHEATFRRLCIAYLLEVVSRGSTHAETIIKQRLRVHVYKINGWIHFDTYAMDNYNHSISR